MDTGLEGYKDPQPEYYARETLNIEVQRDTCRHGYIDTGKQGYTTRIFYTGKF